MEDGFPAHFSRAMWSFHALFWLRHCLSSLPSSIRHSLPPIFASLSSIYLWTIPHPLTPLAVSFLCHCFTHILYTILSLLYLSPLPLLQTFSIHPSFTSATHVLRHGSVCFSTFYSTLHFLFEFQIRIFFSILECCKLTTSSSSLVFLSLSPSPQRIRGDAIFRQSCTGGFAIVLIHAMIDREVATLKPTVQISFFTYYYGLHHFLLLNNSMIVIMWNVINS